MHKLRKSERCPLHGRLHCCGRTKADDTPKPRKYETIAPGVRRYPDGREICSASALKKRKDALIRQGETCVFCRRPFDDYRSVDLCHIESKGAGGWKHDDSIKNLTLGHHSSNVECGSLSVHEYIKSVRNAGKFLPCEITSLEDLSHD